MFSFRQSSSSAFYMHFLPDYQDQTIPIYGSRLIGVRVGITPTRFCLDFGVSPRWISTCPTSHRSLHHLFWLCYTKGVLLNPSALLQTSSFYVSGKTLEDSDEVPKYMYGNIRQGLG